MKPYSFSEIDKKWMLLALELAHKGLCSTTPNPCVGAVIIDQAGNLVGQGSHFKAGEPHAEAHALMEAKELAFNGTCYVTLEPCSHEGKTPPCADALVAAGIKRVVIASIDTNPLVKTNGIEKLKKAGVEVQTGLFDKESHALNKAFMFRMQHNLPFVSVKLASSMDGKTALSNGVSKWITGEPARRDVQEMRAQCCAILTGADTVIADNPQLNVRHQLLCASTAMSFEKRSKQPLRVIIDGQNRLNDDYQLFHDGQAVLVFNASHNTALSQAHTKQVQVAKQGEFLDLNEIMLHLVDHQINHVWVEAGASLSGALIQQRLVNQLILYQAPKLLGANARSLCNTSNIDKLDDAIDLKLLDTVQIGEDLRHCFELVHQCAQSLHESNCD